MGKLVGICVVTTLLVRSIESPDEDRIWHPKDGIVDLCDTVAPNGRMKPAHVHRDCGTKGFQFPGGYHEREIQRADGITARRPL